MEASSVLLGLSLLTLLLTQVWTNISESKTEREKRILSLFTVVRFENGACAGSNSRNGTCTTPTECSNRNGVSAGSCASGYGVCCTFTRSCGAVSSENCTYFDSSALPTSGTCRIAICPCSNNICQLRLDFSNFVISGPSMLSTSIAKATNGVIFSMGEKSVASATQCLTDTFSVTNPGGNRPSTICGTNTGEHMYVDASEQCNDLTFNLGGTGQGTTLATRSFDIKITQYDCNFSNLAPSGCTQYFYGSASQTVQTYNFDGGSHLANQDQNICVRRERSFCRICWTTQADADFMLSGKTDVAAGVTDGLQCCGYGADGKGTNGFDCVVIPGASKLGDMAALVANAFCGRSKGLVTAAGGAAMTICTRQTPFNIRFLSDNFEFGGADKTEAAKADKGFKLTYIQQAC